MTNSSKKLAPSKAFFEFFQMNGLIEIKAIIPCDLLLDLLNITDEEVTKMSSVLKTGKLVDYLKSNLILTNNNGNKIELSLVNKIGRDFDTKMIAFQLIFEKSDAPIKWICNSFLLDKNVNHLNLHKLDEDEDEFVITSVDNEQFLVTGVKKNYAIWLVVITIILGLIAFGMYSANV